MRLNKVVFKVDGMEVREYHSRSRSPRQRIFIPGKKPQWLHHYMVERYIRPMQPGEIVHHKDGDPLNNIVSNLEIMTRAEHVKFHKPVLGYKFTDEQKKRLSDAHIGQNAWNKGSRGFKHSEESKRNMSAAQKGRDVTWGHKISITKEKVTKKEILEYLNKNQTATTKDIMAIFRLKSKSPIFRHGGLKKLKREATR